MDPIFFLKGLVVGFAIAVPIGPIGILCIRKSLADGRARGLVIGLGAATADSVYSGIAAFGLTFLSEAIVSQELWLRLAGGALLLFLGIRILSGHQKEPEVPVDRKEFAGSYVSALLLGLTNPVTIVAFVAVFAALGLEGLEITSAIILVLGVFTGSCLWFLTLGQVAARLRTRLSLGSLRWVNRITGGLIIVSGIAAFVSVM
ncbi:MAG: LysE family transporter [Ignavibacteriales bacterium]|nr:LysE family transporter [Ignavibacteriales bacterium]